MAIFGITAAITSFITTSLVSLGLSTAAAGIGANLLVGAGLSLASSLLKKQSLSGSQSSTQDGRAVLNQPVMPRRRGYGKYEAGGPRAEWMADDNGDLWQVIVGHTGLISGYEQFWIGDQEVEIDADGWVTTPPFNKGDPSYVQIKRLSGYGDQEGFPELRKALPNRWNKDDKFKGLACWLVRFTAIDAEDYQEVFPRGYNTQVTAEINATRLYDPRTRQKEKSNNAALALMDFLTSPDGFGIEDALIDHDSFAEHADLCDQLARRGPGLREARYRITGSYSLQDPRKEVLEKIKAVSAAELYEGISGQVKVRGGKWVEPTVRIPRRHIKSFDMTSGSSILREFNELKILYTNPQKRYTLEEAVPFRNLEDQRRRGKIESEFTVSMCPSGTQAQRLAKIHDARENPDWRGTITTDIYGLKAWVEGTIFVEIEELGIDRAFTVDAIAFDGQTFEVAIDISSIDASAYGDDIPFMNEPPVFNDPPSLDLPVPLNVTATLDGTDLTISADAPPRKSLALVFQYRKGTGKWRRADTDENSAVATVTAGQTYSYRARYTTPNGVFSEWSTPQTIAT